MTAGEWADIGTVATGTGTLVIVDPGAAGIVEDTWLDVDDAVNFDQLPLPEPLAGMLLATRTDGQWTVQGRFCPDVGGSLMLCALKIELHGGPHDEDDDDAT